MCLLTLIFPKGRRGDAAYPLLFEGNTIDGPNKLKKLSYAQDIDNNAILKVKIFQTHGTIGLFASLNFSRNGPHRPPLRVKWIKESIYVSCRFFENLIIRYESHKCSKKTAGSLVIDLILQRVLKNQFRS